MASMKQATPQKKGNTEGLRQHVSLAMGGPLVSIPAIPNPQHSATNEDMKSVVRVRKGSAG
jgi:hypothetical protein